MYRFTIAAEEVQDYLLFSEQSAPISASILSKDLETTSMVHK